jgi:hypothetical protein
VAAAFVQSSLDYVNSTVTSFVLTLVGTPTANNLLVASVGGRSISGDIGTPTGWTLLYRDNAGGAAHAAFYKIADGTETSVTFTFPDDCEPVCAVHEFSGLDAVSPLDQVNMTAIGGATARTAGPLTPASAPGLAFTSMGGEINSNAVTITTPSEFTALSGRSVSTFNPSNRAARFFYSTTDAISAEWLSSPSHEYAAGLAIFLEPSGGASLPTLTAASAINIGTTTLTPRVTFTTS